MSLTGFLSYSRVNWQQSPSKSTPWNATNLNIMDKGIKDNNDMIANLRDEVSALNNNKTNYFTYAVQADNVDDFIKKAVLQIGTISDGTFTVRGSWDEHDFFFMTGFSFKNEYVAGFLYTPTGGTCGAVQGIISKKEVNFKPI